MLELRTITVVLALLLPFAASAQLEISIDIERFDVTGPNPLPKRETRKVLEPFLGKHDSIEVVGNASAALEEALRESGYAFHRVFVPPQPIDAQIIQLEIKAFPVEEILIEGNRFFSNKNVLRSLRKLKVGRAPNTLEISRQLGVANVHPSKDVQLTFAASESESGGVIGKLAVRDRRPAQIFAWANDTGSEATGRSRVGLGLQHANVFGRDHVSTATWTTTTEDRADVQQYGLSYQIPMYRLGAYLTLYGLNSDVDSGIVADVFDVAGRGEVYGAQILKPLARRGKYSHSLSLTFDDKLFDNEIDFAGQPIGVDIRSRPVGLVYRGRRTGERVRASMSVGLRANTGGGEHNDEASYEATRPGAERDWSAASLDARLRVSLGKFAAVLGVHSQFSDDLLIPGEQFSIAGARGVRGLEEREVAGDSGYTATLALETPPVRGVRAVVFVDGGTVRRRDPAPGEVDRETLVSTGLGLRWRWRRNTTVEVDYAYVVDGTDPAGTGRTRDGDSRLHASLFFRF